MNILLQFFISNFLAIMSEKRKIYAGKKGTKTNTASSKRSKISNRRPQNRYEKEEDPENVNTSVQKLNTSRNNYEVEVNNEIGYRLINFLTVFVAIAEMVVCKKCGKDVKFSEASKRGLGFKIIVSCKECGQTAVPSCPYVNCGYEVNRRIVFAMRLLGVGLHGIIKFCAFMDLPRPVFQTLYDKIIANLATTTAAVRLKCTKRAAEEEKRLSEENGQIDGLIVSGDGSWRKRGFSSLYGLVTLIGWYTGKVIDIVVKFKYCKSCEFWSQKEGTAEYNEWAETHSNECQINHDGSSGQMEVDSMIEMFQRSETFHNIKYANYIGDGDSKTFKGVLDANPYENFIVKKKECIDHVQNRMRTRLRNLKENTKRLGGKDKLTGKLIDELSIYYGLAIRRNPDSIEKMRNDIWATLSHKLSTDAQPQHEKCPEGEQSWCSWQRAKAANTLHEYVHKPPLHLDVFAAIKPVYEDLSSDDLLSCCLGGYTQNKNESYNNCVWSMAPKAFLSGKTLLNISADIATCHFNDGFNSLMEIMQVLGVDVGPSCYNFCVEADARRVKFAERKMSDAAKDVRRISKLSRKEKEEANLDLEGQLYGAGIAD